MKIKWWPLTYKRKWLRFDLIAGLATAAVVIPKSMAFATIAGFPVEVGLYTALVPMVVYALLGTSKQLSVTTTTTIAILAAVEVAKVAPNAASGELIVIAATLAFMVGAFLIVASLLRLGFLANFISLPVLTGFKAGIGIVIIVDQLPKLLGFQIAKGGFIQNIYAIAHSLPALNVPTLILALLTLILIFGTERFFPRFPAPLLSLVVGVLAVTMFGLQHAGIKLTGAIPIGLPNFSVVKLSLLEQLWPGALGIALMSFIESIASGRAFLAHKDSTPNADQELFALGAANLAGSFFQSMPAGGGTTQTAVNIQSGARSQASELTTAAFAVVALLFFTPFISKIPQASLAAVVVATTIVLLNPADFRAILDIRIIEFTWAIAAVVGVVLFGVLHGILVAVLLSLLTLMYQANHPPIYALGRKKGTKDVFRALEAHPKDEIFAKLLIMRTEGTLTFASMPSTKDKFYALVAKYNPKIVLLDLSAVPDIEYTALMMLDLVAEKLEQRGIELWLAALNPNALEVVLLSPFGKKLGKKRMFFTVEQALKHYESP